MGDTRDTTVRRPVRWDSEGDTNAGMVRAINEDAILSRPEAGMWVVADGMGGHEAGDVASRMIVTALEEIDKQENIADMVDCIEDSLLDVNARLLEYAEIMLEGSLVGSTVTGLVINGQAGVCIWAGDSRLYRYRNGELQQISRDHSEVAELVASGAITEREAEDHPDANVITRAVGTSEQLYLDVDVFSARIGDCFLLCSDGLYNTVGTDAFVAALAEEDMRHGVERLIQAALDAGAPDNVSALLVKGVPARGMERSEHESVQPHHA